MGEETSPVDPIEDPGEGGADAAPATTAVRKPRRLRPFPAISFNEALVLATAIQVHGAGQKIRRLTLFEALDRSPDSGPTRKLITSSSQYGLTVGSYSAESLDLTDAGRIASDPSGEPRSKLRAQFELAIERIESFKSVFEKYRDNRLPTVEVLRDAFLEFGVDQSWTSEAVEIFLANARELGLVRSIAGAERLVSIESVIDQLPTTGSTLAAAPPAASSATTTTVADASGLNGQARPLPNPVHTRADLSKICFIISPIGGDDTEQRLHANMVLGSLIEPALAELGLTAVRADQIEKPGLITSQVIDHIARSALVVADLSFANPNVYYELALRQAVRKPMVQICRASDPLPFDVGQFRTYMIDMSSTYALVPQIELHRKEITRRCRSALEDGTSAESQLTQFYPQFWDHIGR